MVAYRPGLSPSRASDFQQCPLLFRFRVVDQLPEPISLAATRGTLVHAVLEELYAAPRGTRTPEMARALLPAEWEKLLVAEPRLAELFAPGGGAPQPLAEWLAEAERLLETYFTLEDPNTLAPEATELWVQHQLEGGPLLRGVVDRLDVSPAGDLRVVDYKTGKSPRPQYEGTALFQMRFYAMVLFKERGVLPKMLQLVYLGDGQVLRATPSQGDLELTEHKARQIWEAIETAGRDGRFVPRRSKLCGWCAHQAQCPEFGGTPPPLDPAKVAQRLGVEPRQAAVA
ncbi:MAG: PD-(D/E)XK nuclease family protein [Promicromonosporaceae bacterium]|nr:PD-(D/E)XK nuclease family protein [Promicromonosporaceae bacterium]